MKIAILVLTCDKPKYNESRRKQWEDCLKDTNVPIFYIFGKTDINPYIPVRENIFRIISDVTDNYEEIPRKMFYAYNMLRNFFDAIIKIDDNVHIGDINTTIDTIKEDLKSNPYLQLIGFNRYNKSFITDCHHGRSDTLDSLLAIIPPCIYAGGSAYALRFDALSVLELRDFNATIFEDLDVGYKLNKFGITPYRSNAMSKFIDVSPVTANVVYSPLDAGEYIIQKKYLKSPDKICSILIRGGLGNQLFMLCTALAHAVRTNSRLRVVWFSDEWRPQYFDTILSRFSRYIEDSMPTENIITYVEDQYKKFGYVRLPYTEKGVNLNLIGYFQSSKYFPELKPILHLLPNFPESKAVDDIVKNSKGTPIILHVRRTDYLPKADIHHVQPISYYERAIAIIRENITNPYFLLISDDIPFLSNIPVKPEESQIIDLDDIHTMKLMSKCRYFIIANSTFSWWGAMFGRAKMVIAPKTWFGPNGPQDWQDIYEKEWLVI